MGDVLQAPRAVQPAADGWTADAERRFRIVEQHEESLKHQRAAAQWRAPGEQVGRRRSHRRRRP